MCILIQTFFFCLNLGDVLWINSNLPTITKERVNKVKKIKILRRVWIKIECKIPFLARNWAAFASNTPDLARIRAFLVPNTSALVR